MDAEVIQHQLDSLTEVVQEKNDSSFLLHEMSLAGAKSLTNGKRGDPGALSDQMALVTALIVGNRLGEEKRHMAECIVMKLTTRDADGKTVYPWDREKVVPQRLGSALAINWKEKKVDVSGPVAFLFTLLLFFGGIMWLRSSLIDAGRANATRVITVAENVAEKVAEKLESDK